MPNRFRLVSLVALCVLCSPSAAHAEGLDPGLALWGSSAVALLFTLAGSIALAWYHRAQGATDGRIGELREQARALEALLRTTREEYARKTDIERLNTLERSLRDDIDARILALRTEVGTQLKELRAEQADLRREVNIVHMDVQKILGALTGSKI